jgi:hypothetical protein
MGDDGESGRAGSWLGTVGWSERAGVLAAVRQRAGAPWLALRAHDSCFEPKSKHEPIVHADRPSSGHETASRKVLSGTAAKVW